MPWATVMSRSPAAPATGSAASWAASVVATTAAIIVRDRIVVDMEPPSLAGDAGAR